MTWKWWAVVLGVVAAALLGRVLDLRTISGDIKGDEATYISMAWSLAEDGDLYYEPEDYQRFVAQYPKGPGGIFLKRRYALGLDGATRVPSDQSLAYAKALAYPVAAAPFILLGGLGGLVVFNWLMLALCVWCLARFAVSVTGISGWLIGIVFVGASVVPLYAAWATSEIFHFTLVTLAYYLWLSGRGTRPGGSDGRPWTMWAAAFLIGVATYSKPTHVALILPLVVDAWWTAIRAVIGSGRLTVRDAVGRHSVRALVPAVLVSSAFLVGSAGLFGVHALVMGDPHYQGAEDATSRRTFAETFPFDNRGTTFDQQGTAMVTNDADTGRVLAPQAIEQIPVNTWYFFVGRHAGLVPYYLPGVLIAAWWLVGARRAPLWQWTTFVAVTGSIGGFVVFFPDSWNGGGGPVGNRYFLGIYPTLLFLLRPSFGLAGGLTSLVGGLAFVGHVVTHPYASSSEPWKAAEVRPLNWLPIELTLVNDLPCRINALRCPILFVQEPAVQFYYMDGRTYSAEGEGTWIAGGASTDIIVKTDLPPSRVRIEFSSRVANEVRGRLADRAFSITVPAGGRTAITVVNPAPFRYHQNSVYVLHLETTNGFVPAETDPGATDTRNLGVFIRPTFSYGDRTP